MRPRRAFPDAAFAGRQGAVRSAIAAVSHDSLVATGPETIGGPTGDATAGSFAFPVLLVALHRVALARTRVLPQNIGGFRLIRFRVAKPDAQTQNQRGAAGSSAP